MPKKSQETVNIFDLLSEEEAQKEKHEQKPKSVRDELLGPMKVKDFFKEGSIKINNRTCRGVECNLCVKACPTNALYWKAGEIGIIEDLCIHCAACVLNCMVDDCIEVTRKREDGKIEIFRNPKDVLTLHCNVGSKKRNKRLESLFPKIEDYFDRYGK
ncbi:hypothetical protein AC477_02890 [miscellaneous Crenarchaeota group-1 archaeon SG8-32-1]|uniref:4Fe-4S ferredoxin-type domain-containing protein n=1 Tax=miscellaneous Crenarchaeota group-1 archaeon SG8-32-1 TaxID=1685124 RepID=A0A0M0BVQ3_9ARCH|nr:MAG: hypothetical protein AC477_02890 [miscellaneous Crenarchaeota group-1 archaeon SG8-32-1]